jgi:hypothetical protein
MLVKSVKFNNDFIYNLYDIVFSSREYSNQLDSILSILKEGDSIPIGYQQQPFKNVKFVGSYINKKDGDYLTDIDIIQLVNINVNFVKRISQIMKNLDETNFIFARFYCGYVEYLQTPWSFDAEGSCDVDLDKMVKNNTTLFTFTGL